MCETVLGLFLDQKLLTQNKSKMSVGEQMIGKKRKREEIQDEIDLYKRKWCKILDEKSEFEKKTSIKIKEFDKKLEDLNTKQCDLEDERDRDGWGTMIDLDPINVNPEIHQEFKGKIVFSNVRGTFRGGYKGGYDSDVIVDMSYDYFDDVEHICDTGNEKLDKYINDMEDISEVFKFPWEFIYERVSENIECFKNTYDNDNYMDSGSTIFKGSATFDVYIYVRKENL